MSIVVDVPLASILDPSKMGFLIGVKGRNLKNIERANKVLIQIQLEGTSHFVRITGLPDKVAMAKINVLQLICGINKHDSRHVFTIPTRLVGYLIGKSGSKINEIKNTSGAKVLIDKSEKETPESEYTTVMVYGDWVEITSAMCLIDDRLSSFGNFETIYERPDKKEFFENWDELDLQ